jgi:type I restriction enzyme S subunit
LREVRLSKVCTINPPRSKELSAELLCSFVPMDYVDEESGAISRTDVRPVAEVRKGYTEFREKDVIFAKITPCMENGKCAIAKNLINEIGFGSTEFHVLRANSKILPEWIYYYLRQERIRQQAVHWFRGTAGQQRVPSIFLEELQIPLPTLSEQQRIATILDQADRLRRLRRYALELGDSYLQSVFLDMFGDLARNLMGWKTGKIRDVVTFSQYGTSKKSNDKKRGYPVLGMGSITYSGEIDLSNLSYVELDEEEFQSLRLDHGDIIFNRTNSTELVGKTAYWDLEIDAVIASYLVRLKLGDDVLPEYFTALLNSPYYKALFQLRCRKAVGQSNISPTYLKEFPVLIPSDAAQKRYAKIVKRFKRLRSQRSEALRQAEHLFQSLLHRAFEGEL